MDNELSRRRLLRDAGLLGAGVAAGTAFGLPGRANAQAAAAEDHPRGGDRDLIGGFHWLTGDHHVHTLYSVDGMYRVLDQVRHTNANGLDWVVITDHGQPTHAGIGAAATHRDIAALRDDFPDLLVFQGLEWNVPAAEHATVFVHPGPGDVDLLREFESTFDADVVGARASTVDNERLAVAGICFLASAVEQGRVRDALFIANHPARRGVNTPHEIRGWRDAQPRIAIGFEGAPGHQPSGIAPPYGIGLSRGLYNQSASTLSFPAYPPESYRTWGGFDWMTATVGGLWDSLLAEGKPWWITASSDSHQIYADTAAIGPNSDFATNGRYNDPVYLGNINPYTFDYWPGFYSRTHVGTVQRSYAAVMAGLRAGRVWVDHGGLIAGLDARVRCGDAWATLGDTLEVRRGSPVRLDITLRLASEPNWAQFVPRLSRVDVVRGTVTGPASDPDTLVAPAAVAQSYAISQSAGTVSLRYDLGPVDGPCYVRLRGTDGNRTATGLRGAAVDPVGPAMDVPGSADPWTDLWFYSNPIFVRPVDG
jgi:hypothetical protein